MYVHVQDKTNLGSWGWIPGSSAFILWTEETVLNTVLRFLLHVHTWICIRRRIYIPIQLYPTGEKKRWSNQDEYRRFCINNILMNPYSDIWYCLNSTSVNLICCSSCSAAVRGAGEEQDDMWRRYPWKHTSSCKQTDPRTTGGWGTLSFKEDSWVSCQTWKVSLTSTVPNISSLMWPPPNSFFSVARVAAYIIFCLTWRMAQQTGRQNELHTWFLCHDHLLTYQSLFFDCL